MDTHDRRLGHKKWILYLFALVGTQYCAYLVLMPPCSTPTAPGGTLLSNAPFISGGRDQYALARTQSFGFFYDITEEHWNLLRQIYKDHSNHLNPDRPLMYNPHNEDRKGIETWGDPETFSSYKAWYQSNYEPNFSCQFEKRVGKNMNGDGPKWICDPHRIKKLAADRKAKDPTSPGCVVYSIGSSGSFIFEIGMQNEIGAGVCEYHIFDFGDYEKQVPKELQRVHYHKWGLQKQDPNASDPIAGKRLYGLRDTIKLLGHERLDMIDVFKIDCENCEWETFGDWLADDIPLLHQVQVEVHGAPGKTAVDFFDSLERAGYLRFHKEPNIQYNPGCIEFAFVKVDPIFMNFG
ncbi:hypothetical protein ACHAXR_008564 [Thalassiosira sp. AJA248-18]